MSVKPERKTIAKREDMMAIALPNEYAIRLFWIKGAEWLLMTIYMINPVHEALRRYDLHVGYMDLL
jgi:hypothetical protein